MDTEGLFAPETREEVQKRYASLATTASETVRATTREMGFDGEEYDERVSEDVRDAARDAIFTSLLAVQVGTDAEFDSWSESFDGDTIITGSEHVDRVVWHAPPWSDIAVAATFQSEREAAITALRQQAFGRLYQEVLDR